MAAHPDLEIGSATPTAPPASEPTLSSIAQPSVAIALPDMGPRKVKTRYSKLAWVSIALWVLPPFLLISPYKEVACILWAVCVLSSFILGCVITGKHAKLQPKQICRGCGRQPVSTPYCPYCGTKDPLGDYEEWYRKYLVEEREKKMAEEEKVRVKEEKKRMKREGAVIGGGWKGGKEMRSVVR